MTILKNTHSQKMPTQLKIGKDKLTVPYDPQARDGSYNYGYFNLKANPSLIKEIHEVQGWHEIENLLRAINSPLSHFQTLGCEKVFSGYRDAENPQLTMKLASYVDIAFSNISSNAVDYNFDCVVSKIRDFSKGYNAPYFSDVDFELTPTFYEYENIQGWSLTCRIRGYGCSKHDARENWAVLAKVLHDFFLENWVPDFTTTI
jgi:hypothetical protein